MFKKHNRLSSWLFKPLLKGKTEFSSCFRLKHKNNNEHLRISIVIPKKIIKQRVARNRLKRKILNYLKEKVDLVKQKNVAIWLTKDVSDKNWKKEINDLIQKMDIKKQ